MRQRPAPVVDALLALLEQDIADTGLTTAELATGMGRSLTRTSAKLSRMRAYGYVTRTPDATAGTTYPQRSVRWKLRERRRC